MKEFEVKKFLNNEIFFGLIKNIIDSKNKEDLLSSLKNLDNFVSNECEIKNINIVFENIKDSGEFKQSSSPYYIAINERYCDCSENEYILSIYFHEKRHQLQYECYLENNNLLGEKMNEEIDLYVNKKEKCVITNYTLYNGIWGYYCRLNERDAHLYEMSSILDICNGYNERLFAYKIQEKIIKHYEHKESEYNNHEFLYWIENHKQRFFARKKVEEELLFIIKERLRNNSFDRNLKKFIYSGMLFDCLNDEEKEKVLYMAKKSKKKVPLEECDRNLLNLIVKLVKKKIKNDNKKSFSR